MGRNQVLDAIGDFPSIGEARIWALKNLKKHGTQAYIHAVFLVDGAIIGSLGYNNSVKQYVYMRYDSCNEYYVKDSGALAGMVSANLSELYRIHWL